MIDFDAKDLPKFVSADTLKQMLITERERIANHIAGRRFVSYGQDYALTRSQVVSIMEDDNRVLADDIRRSRYKGAQ